MSKPRWRPAQPASRPAAPLGAGGKRLAWSPAKVLSPVRVVANRDSAVVRVPLVKGARDYRVFALGDAVTVRRERKGETVGGAHIFCAGLRQQNAPAEEDVPVRDIEIAGLRGPTRVVVEAIDRLCPFTGVRGAVHGEVTARNTELRPEERVVFPLLTRSEATAPYGSFIENGHGAGPLALPAPYQPPTVLARTTIVIEPHRPAPPVASFFDEFADDSDQPVFISALPDKAGRSQRGKLFQNSRWNFHSYGAATQQFFIAEGRLHTVLADWAQDIFSSNVAYPRSAVRLSSAHYLHATFEVASNSTQRRYWWFFLCGAPTSGATIDTSVDPSSGKVRGTLRGEIVQTAFFYQNDGRNPSIDKWNCLQVFPRDGWPFALRPSRKRPQSDLRVMVNIAGEGKRDNVVNVSPPQYRKREIAKPGWFRQQDADGKLLGPMLDDKLLIAPRTRFDIFVRRDRVVVYVDGEQRLCNDFPKTPLTMAEAAVGFGQILYHSAAERREFSNRSNKRTGQKYYLQNTPYVDVRTWDNLGYQENAAAPGDFDAASCYVSDATL